MIAKKEQITNYSENTPPLYSCPVLKFRKGENDEGPCEREMEGDKVKPFEHFHRNIFNS